MIGAGGAAAAAGGLRGGARGLVPRGVACRCLLTPRVCAARRRGRDAGLHGTDGGLQIRLALDPGIQEKVIELSFPGVVFQKAEDQLGDQRRHKAGEHPDQQREEDIGRIVRHEIVPREHHQQHPDRAGEKKALSAHQAEPRDAGRRRGDMPGGEGEAVLRRGSDKLPPLAELVHGLKGSRARDGIL